MRHRTDARARALPGPPGARGSAMTETVVLMAAMVPLMFAIPMIGKLVDLNQTAVQAGRYATWEATVHHDPEGGAAAPGQVAGRFFGEADAPILSHAPAPGTHALWGDGTASAGGWEARTGIEIDGTSVETLRYAPDERADMPIAGAVGATVSGLGEFLASGDGASWGLGDSALVRSGVRVKVRENGWFEGVLSRCGGAFACLEEAGTIMTDGWSAGSQDEAKDRVRAMVPARVLDPVGDGLSQLGRVRFLSELRPLKDAFGHVGDFTPAEAERGGGTYGLQDYVEE